MSVNRRLIGPKVRRDIYGSDSLVDLLPIYLYIQKKGVPNVIANTICIGSLRPGDAVLLYIHILIFTLIYTPHAVF